MKTTIKTEVKKKLCIDRQTCFVYSILNLLCILYICIVICFEGCIKFDLIDKIDMMIVIDSLSLANQPNTFL